MDYITTAEVAIIIASIYSCSCHRVSVHGTNVVISSVQKNALGRGKRQKIAKMMIANTRRNGARVVMRSLL